MERSADKQMNDSKTCAFINAMKFYLTAFQNVIHLGSA